MAGYLSDYEVPIDYQWRRRLDYSMLLPDKVWSQICRDTATPGRRLVRARIARCFLFERLSGLPATASPWAMDDSAFRTKTVDFPRHLTPELTQALTEHAGEFLADHGIDDEPAVWHPPNRVLDGLNLPGTEPDAVDLADLDRVMAVDAIRLGSAAHRLNTSADTVRYLLEIHAASSQDPEPDAPLPIPYNRAYSSAKATLSRERLADLYERQRMSLRDIAATVGVSRQTIARLAHDYELLLREPGGQTHTMVDRDWLYAQYVMQRRTLPDLAKEAGMSTANMARWAKTYVIPLRGRGQSSHTATLAAQNSARDAPELIRSTLARSGGWQRLERFAGATRYPTLTEAAEALGLSQFTLVNQINRVEREFGTKILIRAQRGRPMELTAAGTELLASIRAWERKALC